METTYFIFLWIPNFVQVSACTDGYWGNQCTFVCNCLKCDRNTGRCSKCNEGFYLDYNGYCQYCSYRGCLCTREYECTNCMQGYYSQSSSCYKCSDECISCTDRSTCNVCKNGFYSKQCEISCSTGCRNSSCDKGSGSCTCKPNFTGNTCDTCVTGKYGSLCNADCSLGCSDLCDSKTGRCNCKPNFTGVLCDTCIDGWYGTDCNTPCNPNCNSCENASDCISCKTGLYGPNCQWSCSSYCAYKQCDKQSASCSTCLNGRTGHDCYGTCPSGCLYDTCQQYTGECTHGCKQGFYGAKCENQCPSTCLNCTSSEQCHTCISGNYGLMCEKHCPETCQYCNSNGKCTSCKPEFFNPDLQCRCSDGFCGSNLCRSCTNSTYYSNGHTCCPCSSKCKNAVCSSALQCTHGCADGYFGPGCPYDCTSGNSMCMTCSGETFNNFICTSCIGGYYPHTNRKCITCSASCLEGNCNSSNGHCEKGCQNGHWNSKCDTKCNANCSVCDQNSGKCLICSSPRFFGSECDKPCGNNCINASCHVHGTCTSGCISDYFGAFCDKPCLSNCARSGNESRCSPDTGRCLFGCSAGFTGESCMEALKQGSSEDTVPAAAIGGGVAAAVIVALIVVIGIVIFIRRRHREPKPGVLQETSHTAVDSLAPVYASVTQDESTGYVYENAPPANADIAAGRVQNPVYTNTRADRNLKREVITSASAAEDSLEIDELDYIARQHAIRFEENGGVYYNNANEVKKFKIPVAELQKFVLSKNMEYFETEFEKLPYGLLKDYQVSQMKENIAKNRYKGIYPYDDHRVKVRGGDSDYINASFIDGYKRRNEYIATLGPMSKQLGDFGAFWRMVWQQRVEKIVMVTNLVEEGTDKCEQYWPNAGASQMYGDIRVLCQSEDEYAEFTRRTFTVVKDKEQRTLNHLHFTSWPDKDVPEDVTSIIEFRQKVISAPATLGGPVLVHCSAGIGRTGTYIALDILTKEGEEEGAVDIAGCVLNMRQNRPSMVQTVGQYEYLHHAVVHSLTFDCKPVAGERFQSYMDRTPKDQIMHMFHQLQRTTKRGSMQETEAVKRNAKLDDKNRDGSDIPGDEHRPRIYLNKTPACSDYINAVFVNSFQTMNKYILAQTPLPTTVTDFLALVVQTDCVCIVSFETTSIHTKDVGVYFPADNQVLKRGIFSVRCSKPEANEYRIKRTLAIEHRTSQMEREMSITHLEFTDWNTEQNIPNSPFAFRRFIAEVDVVTANTNADRPVIIHCMDGASKSGLFCVVATLLQKMEVEHEVSVVNAVRKVKARRKRAILNPEQFQFCHDCVLDYIQSFDIYSNFAADLSD